MSGTFPRNLSKADVRKTVRATFGVARRVDRGELAVRFVSESEISKLNLHHCGKRKPTDVLAFPAKSSEPGKKEWGDLFIATSYAKREAAKQSIPLSNEIIRLLSHGTLHLLGYDHRNKRDKVTMFSLQERVVARIV